MKKTSFVLFVFCAIIIQLSLAIIVLKILLCEQKALLENVARKPILLYIIQILQELKLSPDKKTNTKVYRHHILKVQPSLNNVYEFVRQIQTYIRIEGI